MQGHLKKLFNFKVLVGLLAMVLVVSYFSFSASVVKVNKAGYSTVSQSVYSSSSTKAKKIGSLKKNQAVYIYANKGSWSQIKYGKTKGWVAKKNLKLGYPVVTVNKDGHATSNQYIYSSQNTKTKRLATVKKNQNVYILSKQGGWYKVKFGKTTGWVIAKHFKMGKYTSTPVGKKYPDGWTAPVLKSSWSSNPAVNYKTLQNELGFTNGGSRYALPEYPQGIIHVVEQGGKNVDITFFTWEDPALPNSYRVPVVSKELFKLYFGKDGQKVWDYFNNNDIPDRFTANRFNVKSVYSSSTGGITLMLR